MARRFRAPKLVVASHNKGKIREISDLLRDFEVEIVAAHALGLPEPEETGTSFVANAELKAQAAATAAQLPALADDSGLAVDALDGAPGIYSARWAENAENIAGGRDFSLAMQKIMDEVTRQQEIVLSQECVPPYTARFICALSLAWPDGHVEIFEGTVEGTLVWPPRGAYGFGYDPMFLPLGSDLTFGEMKPTAKHAISHRADAFVRLVEQCFVD